MRKGASRSRFARPWIIVALSAIVAIGAWHLPRGVRASAQDAAPAANVVHFAADQDYPPFSRRDADGNATGFDVELFRAVAAHAHVQPDIKLQNWTRAVDEVRRGRADVVPMLVTEQRRRQTLFSEPYLHFYHLVFGARGGRYIATLDELDGKRVAVQRGGLAWDELRQRPGIRLVEVVNEPAALLAVEEHQADYALVPSYIGYEALRRYRIGDIVALSPAFFDTEYAFAINPQRPDLVATINQGLREATSSGEAGRLYVQWLANLTPPEETFRAGMLRAAWVIVPLLALAGILLVAGHRAHNRAGSAERRAKHLQRHDPVTQLPNRASFRRTLADLIATQKPFAVIRIDLLELGAVEAIAGHAFVDELLRGLAARLQGQFPIVAKVHDRGFMVAARDAHDADGAQRVMDQILASVGARIEISGLPIEQVACAGAALYPAHGGAAEQLMRASGLASEACAVRPGNGVVYHDALAPDPRRLTQLTELRTAIRERTLGYLVQPKLHIASNRICGAEMLVRWHHPKHGDVPPSDFIPLAERTGVIGEMTLYLVECAVAHLKEWRAQGLELTLSVNVSANDFSDTVLVDRIVQLAADVPGALMLEVTETAVMRDPDKAFAAVDRLRAGGVKISLDDFGTGNASLTYLRRLAPEEVKIDRSFISGVMASEADRAIVRSTIQLAHGVNAVVTAEGVEDGATLLWLGEVGCDLAQGHGIGRPMGVKALTSMPWREP